MRITVVNPNTTASMTAMIGECARAVVGPGVSLRAVNPPHGPAAIETARDEELAVPGVLAEIAAGEDEGVDGYVIACFGDPGLPAARELAAGPVVGIAEAAMRTAGFLGHRFSVITTTAAAVAPTWDLAERYGTAALCGGVHASGLRVLELDGPRAFGPLVAASRAALDADGSDVIVLGCAGMAPLAAALTGALGVPVVDGVTAGVLEVEKLVRLGLRTGRRDRSDYVHGVA